MFIRLARWMALPLVVVVGLLIFAPPALTDDGGGDGNYVGPNVCKSCHPEESKAWANAPHADASKVAAFVEEWKSLNSPGYCLECHTTGYDPNTGLYALEGVTCESCHGAFVSTHPNTPMRVDSSPQACGQCHKSTLNEWEVSKHGQAGIGCVSCHDVHGAAPKEQVSTQLCDKCHADKVASVAHASSSGKGLTCADCHVGPRTGDPTEGHASTGHTFIVGTGTCSRCHGEEVHRGVAAMMGGTPPAEITPTGTPVAVSRPEGEMATPSTAGVAFPIVSSGAVGLILGVLWMRWQGRRAHAAS